jgi:nickel-dependent lactate racemase
MITAHFIAGYAAGPKTILPGASGYRTIFHNHGVIAASTSSRIGVLHGNPCWEDMVEAVGLLDPVLSVNVVLNIDDKPVGAFHGEPISAQESALNLYQSIYAIDIAKKADIVVASANPLYGYLDQCLKTIVHSSLLVKDGGERIVASPCEELLGPKFLRELYYSSLAPWPTVDEYSEMMRSGKLSDVADAVGILKFLQTNNSSLTLVSHPSFDNDLTNLGFSHLPSVQDAFDRATANQGSDSTVLVVPYGAVTHAKPH